MFETFVLSRWIEINVKEFFRRFIINDPVFESVYCVHNLEFNHMIVFLKNNLVIFSNWTLEYKDFYEVKKLSILQVHTCFD